MPFKVDKSKTMHLGPVIVNIAKTWSWTRSQIFESLSAVTWNERNFLSRLITKNYECKTVESLSLHGEALPGLSSSVLVPELQEGHQTIREICSIPPRKIYHRWEPDHRREDSNGWGGALETGLQESKDVDHSRLLKLQTNPGTNIMANPWEACNAVYRQH